MWQTYQSGRREEPRSKTPLLPDKYQGFQTLLHCERGNIGGGLERLSGPDGSREHGPGLGQTLVRCTVYRESTAGAKARNG